METDLYDSAVLMHRVVSTLQYLPRTHMAAFETYVQALTPSQCSAQSMFHMNFLAAQATIQSLLSALARPTKLIDQMATARREAERSQGSIGKSSRWPLGLLDDARQRSVDEKGEKARRLGEEANQLSRELRFTQQTVASELAGWQNMHDKLGKQAIREFARGMVVQERTKLDGMMRALRKLRVDSHQDDDGEDAGGEASRGPTISPEVHQDVTDAGSVRVDEARGGVEMV